MFNFAYKEGLIKNRLEIMKFSVTTKEVQILNEFDHTTLENYLKNNQNFINLGIMLSLAMGFRIGEICALRIKYIDLSRNIISITETLQRVKNIDKSVNAKTVIHIGKPKSRSSIREVPIPKYLVDILHDLINELDDECFLLTGDKVRFVEPRTLENRFKGVLRRCGIPLIKFHSLRHTFATNAVVKELFDYKTLSEILGHSNIQTTLRLYVHPNIQMKIKKIENADADFQKRHYKFPSEPYK